MNIMSTHAEAIRNMEKITKKHLEEEVVRLQQEVKKLTLLVNEINGLTLIKKGNEVFDLIDDALYCAGKYWYDNEKQEENDSLNEIEILAIIIKNNQNIEKPFYC